MKSAAAADDLPRDGAPEIAMVGRSNVGKSSLINALVRQRVARTSAAPGKTRLANIYRVVRGASSPVYLVDLPGYGYARGGSGSVREFAELTRVLRTGSARLTRSPARAGRHGRRERIAALLRGCAPSGSAERHRGPRAAVGGRALQRGRDQDRQAHTRRAIRVLRELQSVFVIPQLPVSAVTGEGLEELWKLIDTLVNLNQPAQPQPPAPTAPQPLRKSCSRSGKIERIDLATLKDMSVGALTKIAKQLDVPGATGMRKQELIFEILKARGKAGSSFPKGSRNAARRIAPAGARLQPAAGPRRPTSRRRRSASSICTPATPCH